MNASVLQKELINTLCDTVATNRVCKKTNWMNARMVTKFTS